ncbi:MAG TPA: DUF5916 domain-containing protein [Terriglobales bacterium]|nr:DUF5916 domain-containing protein [Terriglobales bacterium]
MPLTTKLRWLLLLMCCASFAAAGISDFGSIRIPRVDTPPRLEDFLAMEPDAAWQGKLVRADGFRQRMPSDGAAVSERTDVYLGYDARNLYAIFVCFDSEPRRVRARLSRREDVFDDDFVELMLDTFNDHRHAYAFFANAVGVQADALWTEGPGTIDQNFDMSFDAVWRSSGRVTDRGFVIWMAIPFRSLRFASNDPQTWGLLLARQLPRKNEQAFWPQYSSRILGRLNQAGQATGMEHISPGRNLQLIPYGVFRSFKELDLRDPNRPSYTQRAAFGQVGLDAKVVLKDKFVLDVTANPDFSQVESDDPQITVNQRFEVQFPEKRPFFLENSNYFQTPIQLLFTRRIADPKWGARLTGKDGPWAVGALIAGTDSPGEAVSPNNPLFGQHALFAIGRVSYDVGSQSSIGVLYADREAGGFFNRVGSIDGRFKLNENWAASVQSVFSATINPDDDNFNLFDTSGAYQAGSAAEVILQRDGRKLNYFLDYADRSPNFRTLTGFDPQPDIHNLYQRVQYSFRPEGKHLISWGPMFEQYLTYDHAGNEIGSGFIPSLRVELVGSTFLTAFYSKEMERLRPQDFDGIDRIQKYTRHTTEFAIDTNYFRKFSLHSYVRWGERVNYDPPYNPADPSTTIAPFLASRTSANVQVTIRPSRGLKIDNTYILFRLHNCASCGAPLGSMNNHIIRSRVNYQFSKELSFRFIGQYAAVLATPGFTSLQTTKNFNADFLVTYLVHPNTAIYVGYNSNLENILNPPQLDTNGDLARGGRLLNDGRNFFVKASYLFRF